MLLSARVSLRFKLIPYTISATLRLTEQHFTGSLGERLLFSCTAGVRVVTDLSGKVTAIWGIDDVPHNIQLTTHAGTLSLKVQPNEVWSVDATGRNATRSRHLQTHARARPSIVRARPGPPRSLLT